MSVIEGPPAPSVTLPIVLGSQTAGILPIGQGGTSADNGNDAILNLGLDSTTILYSDPSLAYFLVYDADGNQGGIASIDFAFGQWFSNFGASNNQLLYYFSGAPFGLANAAFGNVLLSNGGSNLPFWSKITLDHLDGEVADHASYTLGGV